MKKNLTELVMILDRSGSMSGLESDTIGGYNAMLKKQRETEGEVLVSTVLFDDRSEVLFDRVPLDKVPEITEMAYYDSVHAFDRTDEINWKQGVGIKTGDTVFMYVGAPVSAILYKCKVTETDIPYHGHHEEINIKALMKIKLQKRYDSERFTFDVLKAEYGIYAVRGPRGIPNSLSEALKR